MSFATGGYTTMYDLLLDLQKRVKLIEAYLDHEHQDESDFGIISGGPNITGGAPYPYSAMGTGDIGGGPKGQVWGSGGVHDAQFALVKTPPAKVKPEDCKHTMMQTFDISPSVTICPDCGYRQPEPHEGVTVMDSSPPEAPIPVPVTVVMPTRVHDKDVAGQIEPTAFNRLAEKFFVTPTDVRNLFKRD